MDDRERTKCDALGIQKQRKTLRVGQKIGLVRTQRHDMTNGLIVHIDVPTYGQIGYT